MQAERLLHLAQQGLAGLMEAHPEETVLLLEDRVEVCDPTSATRLPSA